MENKAKYTLAVSLLMATWWISEALPIYATALMPLALYPLLGVLSYKEVSSPYANHNIFLFMGGFFIAMAMQKWNLHKRIALVIINFIGYSPRRVVLGFMIATTVLSMWISNTATTMMMVPIGIAVILRLTATADKKRDDKLIKNFSCGLMLGIAYAASIGGMCTLIGTPPNLVFMGQVEQLEGENPIDFVNWLFIGIPIGLVFLPLIWLFILHVAMPIKGLKFDISKDVIKDEQKKLGKMSKGEKLTLIIFILTALLWMFRQDKDIEIGDYAGIYGWASLFPKAYSGYIKDSTVAIAMALIMFITPVNFKKREFVLDWEWAKKIPWGIIILFGGGFALARGWETSGLAEWMGDNLKILEGVHPLILIGIICFLMTFLTEFKSNTATTAMFLPIVAGMAGSIGVRPFVLMIPATFSASCAFMLPVATPPNAIVFGSGYVTIPKMAKTGIFLNLIGVVIISLLAYFLVPIVLN